MPAFSADAHARLTGLFADASLDPCGWIPALRALASETGSSTAQLIGMGGPAFLSFNFIDLPPEADAECLAIDGGNPRVNYRVGASLQAAPGSLVHDDHYDASRRLLTTDLYTDYARKWDLPMGAHVTLQQSRESTVVLALLRSERDGRTPSDALALMQAVAPQVAAAVRTQQALAGVSARAFAAGLETAEAAALVCDGFGVVRALTPRAEALLGPGGPLRLDAGRLHATGLDDDRRLGRALREALTFDPYGGGPRQRSLLIRDGEGRPLNLQVDALPPTDWVLPFAPRVLVMVRSRSTRRASEDTVREAFGLTAREASIALELASGLSRETIAQARGVSLATVRQQIKTILQKAGVRREAELIVAVRDLG